jgi:hypothetical protein
MIGHYTCEKRGEIPQIEQDGPFLSIHDSTRKENYKFLGSGYYFWDNNKGMAHAWGQKTHRRRYHIFEAEIIVAEDEMLDLAGNRIDMLYFQELMAQIQVRFPAAKTWTLGQYLYFLRQQRIIHHRAIRAIDTTVKPKEMTKFVPERDNAINLNPVFIICLQDTKPDMLRAFFHLVTFPA